MSKSLEDFFNKLAGKDILQEMKDEEQAKKDTELKKLAEEKEKQEQLEALAIKEKETEKLKEQTAARVSPPKFNRSTRGLY